ncbi:hypothetical protein J2T13_002896 [Paenibacillus sp. DS2015]|uniref:hypothetical protein n=1 Tax=Paenibacillus sp. DS2015 TaxID=3373917 RepID=UPI003D19803C
MEGMQNLESYNWIRAKYSAFISYIERHHEKIPFSKFFLMYLKMPLAARLLLTLIVFGFSHGLTYIIGFIILQSKAKNEVLSLITAFQNPINFSDRLYLYYAFVYLFITILTIIPFGLYLFYGVYLLRKYKPQKTDLFLSVIGWIIAGIAFCFFLYQIVSPIPYYLFYTSKNPSFWEMTIKYFAFSKDFEWFTSSLELTIFQKEVFISLQSGNMAVIFLIFLFVMYTRYYKNSETNQINKQKFTSHDIDIATYKKSYWEILKYESLMRYIKVKKIISSLSNGVFIFIFLFIGLTLFISHTAYQLGSFGKNLTQFDTDFVTVEYNLNGVVQKVDGIRVYQEKNYIVIRDKEDNIHNIYTDQIHIQTK